MRHILNGDAMVEAFEHSRISGVYVVWREALIDGPVECDMGSPRACADRAQALARAYGIDTREYEADFARREAFLAETQAGELVLWFEADSLCELALLDLLGRTHERAHLKVSVVHPPTLALGPEQLREWFEARIEVPLVTRAEARELWRRYCAADPTEFVSAPIDDPWLAEIACALIRDFVSRFPDARGLSLFDAIVLERLAGDPSSLATVFAWTRAEPQLARLGLGDLQVWDRVDDLARRGLVARIEPENTVTATALGLAVLAGSQIATPPSGPIGGADPAAWRRVANRLEAT